MLLKRLGANSASSGQMGPHFSKFQAADLKISQEALAAEVSDCVDRCWEGFIKGSKGGPSTTVP